MFNKKNIIILTIAIALIIAGAITCVFLIKGNDSVEAAETVNMENYIIGDAEEEPIVVVLR